MGRLSVPRARDTQIERVVDDTTAPASVSLFAGTATHGELRRDAFRSEKSRSACAELLDETARRELFQARARSET
jgi:hypothetical protein